LTCLPSIILDVRSHATRDCDASEENPFCFQSTHNEQGRGVGPPGHLRAVLNSSRTDSRTSGGNSSLPYASPTVSFPAPRGARSKGNALVLATDLCFFAPAADNGTHQSATAFGGPRFDSSARRHTPYHTLAARARKTKPSGSLFPSATHFLASVRFPAPIVFSDANSAAAKHILRIAGGWEQIGGFVPFSHRKRLPKGD
jgi:hypothetical protein